MNVDDYKYLEATMSLSSITNNTLKANQGNNQNSGTAVEQSAKRKGSPFSASETAKFSDNVTLTEPGSIQTSEKTAGPDALDSNSADNLLKQVMKKIMTNSKDAISAQAHFTPQAAQALLAD